MFSQRLPAYEQTYWIRNQVPGGNTPRKQWFF